MGYGWDSNKSLKRAAQKLETWVKRKKILDQKICDAGGVARYAKSVGLKADHVYAMSRGDRPISDKALGEVTE